MAVTINSRSVEMTATSDTITLPYKKMITGINFQGTGLTAGQRVTLRDTATVGTGNRLADYETEAATDNGDLWGGRSPQNVSAFSLDNTTVAGTWVLTVSLLD